MLKLSKLRFNPERMQITYNLFTNSRDLSQFGDHE